MQERYISFDALENELLERLKARGCSSITVTGYRYLCNSIISWLALDLCWIASGINVAYLELKLQPYDYAAASVIIEEVGGYIMQADGSAITWDRHCSIVAGTGTSCIEVREVLK